MSLLSRLGTSEPRSLKREFSSFHNGVGQISAREGLFSSRLLPKRGRICDIPALTQSLNDSVLLLTTSGSASNVVKKFEGKKPEDGAGYEHAAWEALNNKHNSHTKEARRACHEKLVNTNMESGQDPDELFFVLNECRGLLGEMGQTVHDKRYENIIFQALPAGAKRQLREEIFWTRVHSAHATHHVCRQPFAPFPFQAG